MSRTVVESGGAEAGSRGERGGPALTATVVGAVALLVVLTLLLRGPTEETLGMLLRATARVSFALFTLTFAAAPLAAATDWPVARRMVADRRWIGLSFGGVHLIHGLLIVTLARLAHDGDLTALSPAVQVVGGIGVFGLIVAMMLTSNDAAVRAMGPTRWKRLHRVGAWTLFVVFVGDYVLLAIVQSPIYWLPAAVLFAVGALRWKLLARRSGREAPP